MLLRLFKFSKLTYSDGPIDLNMNTGVVSFNRSMTALLPTEFSCISVVVPRASAASSFIRRTLYNSVESIGFMCTVIVFTIGRILISKSTLKEWFSIFYSTFAVLLSQTILKPRTSGESIVYGLLLVTSIFTTVMLSGLIFTNLINNPSSKTIQTLDDLAASEYKIITQSNIGNWIDQLRLIQYLKIRNKLPNNFIQTERISERKWLLLLIQ